MYSNVEHNEFLKLEETYTIMNSVGPLLKSASTGVSTEGGTAENCYVVS